MFTLLDSGLQMRVYVSGLILKFSFIVSSWRRLSIDTRTYSTSAQWATPSSSPASCPGGATMTCAGFWISFGPAAVHKKAKEALEVQGLGFWPRFGAR